MRASAKGPFGALRNSSHGCGCLAAILARIKRHRRPGEEKEVHRYAPLSHLLMLKVRTDLAGSLGIRKHIHRHFRRGGEED